ncbi:MAG: hypothetical protein ACO1OT_12405 [Heyndrickxia sp.]
MEPWQKDFSVSRGMVSAISFTSFIVFAISQPLIVQCIDRFGIKKMFVWSSLIAAAVLLGLASLLSALLPKGTETSFPFNVKEANSTT